MNKQKIYIFITKYRKVNICIVNNFYKYIC